MSASPPILIDSSAWIEVLRNRAGDELKTRVTEALYDKRAAMTEPIWLELRRGVRGRAEKTRLESLRGICRWLDFNSHCWKHATLLARACTTKGVNIPLGDILVSACARHHSAILIENDRHFRLIDRAQPH